MGDPWWDEEKRDWNWSCNDMPEHIAAERLAEDQKQTELHGRRISVEGLLKIPGRLPKYSLTVMWGGDLYDVTSVSKRSQRMYVAYGESSVPVQFSQLSQIRIDPDYDRELQRKGVVVAGA